MLLLIKKKMIEVNHMKSKSLFLSLTATAMIMFAGCSLKLPGFLTKEEPTPTSTITEAVTGTPEPTAAPEPTITEAPKNLYDNAAFDIDGLYKVDLEDVSKDLWTIGAHEYGDNMLLILSDEKPDKSKQTLALVDPESLKVIKKYDMGEQYYSRGIMNIKGDKLMYVDSAAKLIYVLDKNLDVENKYEYKGDEKYEFAFSKDWTKLYYIFEEKIFSYDINSMTATQICLEYKKEDGLEFTITDYYAEDNYLIIRKVDYALDQIAMLCYDIENDKIIDCEYEDVDGIYQDEKYTYGVINRDNARFPLVIDRETKDSVATCPSMDGKNYTYEFDYNSNYVFETSTEIYEKEKVKFNYVNIYNLKTGYREYNLAFKIPENQEDITGSMFYMDNKGLLLMAAYASGNSVYAYKLDKAQKLTDDSRIYCYEDVTNELENKLTAVREKAAILSAKYEIEIYLGKDVEKCTDEYYTLTPNTNIAFLDKALDTLDNELGKYPEEMIKGLSDEFGGRFKIFLSGNIFGSSEYSTVGQASGLHSSKYQDTYLCLDVTTASAKGFTGTIHHELFHAFYAHGVNVGSMIDSDVWDKLNPKGFEYEGSQGDDEGSAMQYTLEASDGKVYFIDQYSKTNSDEDKARIFEYAMNYKSGLNAFDGNEHLQAKLKEMSKFLKDVYKDVKMQDVMPWEECLQKAS